MRLDEQMDWMHEMCLTWGFQTRRHLLGGHTDRATGQRHEDGWPKISFIEKFQQLQDGASSGTQRLVQFPEEGLTGDALHVNRAIKQEPVMPYMPYMCLIARYVIPPVDVDGKDLPIKVKAQILDVPVRRFWDNIKNAHYYIAARIPSSAHSVRLAV